MELNFAGTYVTLLISFIDELLNLVKPKNILKNTKLCVSNKNMAVCQYDVVTAPGRGIWFCAKWRGVQTFLGRVQMGTNWVQKIKIGAESIG